MSKALELHEERVRRGNLRKIQKKERMTMQRWTARVMDMLGLNPEERWKPPELARRIPEEELREKGSGFIAIVDRKWQETRIWLCLACMLVDEAGCGIAKAELQWDKYGLTWQAYEIAPFAALAPQEEA